MSRGIGRWMAAAAATKQAVEYNVWLGLTVVFYRFLLFYAFNVCVV
jgi:hypothetical protein